MRGDRKYDLAVIGGGTGGLISSMIAAGAGARVALVERERTGGDCLWSGCVPSKALLAAAGAAQTMRGAGRFGIEAVEPEIDFPGVMNSVRAAQATIQPHDSPERIRELGIDLFEADAHFAAPGVISIGDRNLRFRSAIIATGSRPALPPIPGLAAVDPLTTETVWGLEQLPGRLVIIGGGPIGCELGQAFSRLGSEVTIIEALDRLVSREEPESSDLISSSLESEGVAVRTGVQIAAVTASSEGPEVEFETRNGDRSSWHGSHLLAATGRTARTRDLGLDSVSVAVDDHGLVEVDAQMRTSAKGIYAVGDVTGVMPFTHVAARQARAAAPNAIFGLRSKVEYSSIPWATFTDPEIGRVGMSEAEARAKWGEHARVVQFDYSELDRAIVDGRARGFAKLIADRRGHLVGATVAANGAGDAIAELAAWISQGAGISDVSRQVHTYPTMAEGASRAADEYVTAQFQTPRNRALAKLVLKLRRLFQLKH